MSITLSEKRPKQASSLIINNSINLTAIGAVHINIPFLVNHVDFFTSSFRLVLNNKIIYLDPVITAETHDADYILITHAHQDHFCIDTIKRLVTNNTVIITPQKAYKRLVKKMPNTKILCTEPGKLFSFGSITIKSVAAYNNKSHLLTAHKKSHNNVGYVINFADFSLYHAGDTDLILEITELKNITVVLVPIDGGNLTMSTKQAAELVNLLKPKYAIPMHYNIGTEQLQVFKDLINKSIKVNILDGQS